MTRGQETSVSAAGRPLQLHLEPRGCGSRVPVCHPALWMLRRNPPVKTNPGEQRGWLQPRGPAEPVQGAMGMLPPTSLPGDGLQATGARGQLAGVQPQAAAAVRGLLAGPALDAMAGVLQGRQGGGGRARFGLQPETNSPGKGSSPLMLLAPERHLPCRR